MDRNQTMNRNPGPKRTLGLLFCPYKIFETANPEMMFAATQLGLEISNLGTVKDFILNKITLYPFIGKNHKMKIKFIFREININVMIPWNIMVS